MNEHWNPVLNMFLEIKDAFRNQFGTEALYAYDEKETTCLEYWTEKLQMIVYLDFVSFLNLNEVDGKLILHYGKSVDIFNPEFWQRYDGIYKECRGVVIDIKEDKLLLTPFAKFMNMNETVENAEDLILEKMLQTKKIEISEKLDGSMISGRFIKDKVLLASSSLLSVDKCVQLKEAYHLLTKEQEYVMKVNPNHTFIFELISPEVDPHVVDYSEKEKGLYLVGMRDTETGHEYSYQAVKDIAAGMNLPCTSSYTATIDDFLTVLHSLNTKKSNEAEGFVVNVDGHRFKLKYDDYCLMHRLVFHINILLKNPDAKGEDFIDIIREGRYDDFYAKLPENYKPQVAHLAEKVFTYVSLIKETVQDIYEQVKDLPRKEAMIYIDTRTSSHIRGYVKCAYLGKEWNCLGVEYQNGIKGRPTLPEINKYLETCEQEKENGDYEEER